MYCNGKGYARLPTTLISRQISILVPTLTSYQWYNGYVDIIDQLLTKCWQEESFAENKLRQITAE
ncbi:antitermination protein [Pseudescherichia sp.]|uniref:antitermination protein Q n=1 Tax=Pseudescherichia sp. TaxID=2055881 RepID=UPI0028966DE0|nr:antitermination protein [Pseudescherichia sp.]